MSDEQIPDFNSIDDIVRHAMDQADADEGAAAPAPEPSPEPSTEPAPEPQQQDEPAPQPAPEPQSSDDGSQQDALDPERAKKAIEVAENMAEIWQQLEERAETLSQRERELQEAQLLRQLAVTDPDRFLALVGAKKQGEQKEGTKPDALGDDWFAHAEGEQQQQQQQQALTPEAVQQLLDTRLAEYQRAQAAQQAVTARMQAMAQKVEEYIGKIPELSWNKDMYAERAGALFVRAAQRGLVKLPTLEEAAQMTPQQLEEAYAKAEKAALAIAAQIAEQEQQKLRKYIAEEVARQSRVNKKAVTTGKASADFVPGQHIRSADKTPETVDDLIRMGEQIFRQFEQES